MGGQRHPSLMALTLASAMANVDKFGNMLRQTMNVRRVCPFRRNKHGRRIARRLSLCRTRNTSRKRREFRRGR